MYKLKSNSVEQTIDIANKLSKYLSIGDTILLKGDLGSGKTYFTKGIVQYHLDSNIVSSPTFTIVNEYDTTPPIFHFDVYRLDGVEDFLNMGGDEYLDKGICIFEWGEKILSALPKNILEIHITKLENDTRDIVFLPHGEKYERIMEEYFNENFRN